MSGTRIASVSGLRGVVGDGLDPAIVAEFAAAYASGCGPGPIVVGHDGRVSAPVFVPAVLAGRDRDRPRRPARRARRPRRRSAAWSATWGPRAASRSRPRTTRPTYNGLKFFQPEGMVLGAGRGPGDPRPPAGARVRLGGLGRPGAGPHARRPRLVAPATGSSRLVDVEAIRRRKFTVVLDACHGAGGRLGAALLRAPGLRDDRPGGHPRRPLRPPARADRGEPPGLLPRSSPPSGRPSGSPRTPTPTAWPSSTRPGRYIGEELTLALAALRRLVAGDGAGGAEPLDLARRPRTWPAGSAARSSRTPVGEIHVVERMRAESAVLGGEGNGGVIDPRVGFVRDSFVAHGPGARPAGRDRASRCRGWSTACRGTRWSRTSTRWRPGSARRGRRALGPDRRGPSRGEGRPPRRPPPRLARPLGPRPGQQHRADRPGDRRGRRPRRGAGAGRPDRALGDLGGRDLT